MTEIIRGVYTPNELSINSNGGTEQMAKRMVRDIDPELLKHFQIIHSRVRDLDPDLKKILVLHDLHNDPEVSRLTDPEFRAQFDKLVFVSNWQLQMYNLSLGVPYSQSKVIKNGIEPFDKIEKDYSGPIRLIYHTTPHRGMIILPAIIEELNKHFDTQWDIFSSFGVYGWDHRDEQYEEVFKKLKSFDNVKVWGAQPNVLVRETLKKTHIFAYPSIWPETSCIAAIEALCSGNFVVHPNYAALPETCEHNIFMYDFSEDINQHGNNFYQRLFFTCHMIKEQPDTAQKISNDLQQHFSRIYDWDHIRLDWEALLKGILNGKSKGSTS